MIGHVSVSRFTFPFPGNVLAFFDCSALRMSLTSEGILESFLYYFGKYSHNRLPGINAAQYIT
jgi:hypothetical protein